MKSYLTLVCLFFSSHIFAQKTDIANYNIKAELFPKSKTIVASESITWTNTSEKTVFELPFHLYINAFKNKNSTFFKEQEREKRFESEKVPPAKELGNITLKHLSVNNSPNLAYNYFQADDLNTSDQSTIKVKLPSGIKSGETISIQIDFEVKLPKMIARTGWDENDFFFIGQWFPKIGVLNKQGQWNCHQFHHHTEFFADFGNYNVQLTAPAKFKIAATGQELSVINIKNNRKKYVFMAKKVHDFAWVASPDFIVHTENYKGIKINTFLMPEHSTLQNRYSKSIKEALDYMQAHLGAYPHPSINIIDPPIYAYESNGMEYPMLIGCGSTWGFGESIRMQEVVTIHEFVHQYFQGLLASNEFENSWMDEGFTQYYEGKIMERYYAGSQVSLFGFELNDLQSSRDGYVSMRFPGIAALRTNAWEYPVGTYGVLSYQKTATFLKTLENLLGEKNMDKTMKTYFEKYKFSHPEPADFIAIVKESNPQLKSEISDFVKEAIYSSNYCDYSILNIKGKSLEIEKKGNLNIPVELLIEFTDGSKKTMQINKAQTLDFKKPIAKANIDPQFKNWMDLNWLNNSKSQENTNLPFAIKYASKWLFWLQNFWV